MTQRTKILAAILGLLISFAVGRYSNRGATVVTDKTSKTDTNTQKDKDTHTTTTTTTTKKPDGTTTTITKTDTTSSTHTDTQRDRVSQEHTIVTPQKVATLNISALAGIDFKTQKPIYGASVSKQLVGPITIGLFGITNGTVGASVGISF